MSIELEKYNGMKTRHTCPNCGKRNQFARYIDTEAGEYIAEHVGRCNRENSCGYHYTPKQYFEEFPPVNKHFDKKCKIDEIKPLRIDFIPQSILRASCNKVAKNALFAYLGHIFGVELTESVLKRYNVGSNKDNNTVFWQVDVNGNPRQCKIIRYNAETGKRDKEFFITFAGKSILKKSGYPEPHLVQCFFGEHLLTQDKFKQVHIVESEKTAIISSILMPEYIWLATGGKAGCRMYDKEVNKVLIGRKIVLFPDLGCFEQWEAYAYQMTNNGLNVSVSKFLEERATPEQKAQGLDIADYLLSQAEYTEQNIFTYKDGSVIELTKEGYPAMWDNYTNAPLSEINHKIINENYLINYKQAETCY